MKRPPDWGRSGLEQTRTARLRGLLNLARELRRRRHGAPASKSKRARVVAAAREYRRRCVAYLWRARSAAMVDDSARYERWRDLARVEFLAIVAETMRPAHESRVRSDRAAASNARRPRRQATPDLDAAVRAEFETLLREGRTPGQARTELHRFNRWPRRTIERVCPIEKKV